jgi:hypothetical protein
MALAKPGEPAQQWFETILRQIGQRFCGLKGHQTLVHFEPNRMSLLCSRSGFESRGWHIGKGSPLRDHQELPTAKPTTALVPFRRRLAWK